MPHVDPVLPSSSVEVPTLVFLFVPKASGGTEFSFQNTAGEPKVISQGKCNSVLYVHECGMCVCARVMTRTSSSAPLVHDTVATFLATDRFLGLDFVFGPTLSTDI